MKIKRFLFLQRRAPLSAGPETFDLAMTAAAFEQDVHLLLCDDGVYWLTVGLPDLLRESVEDILVERQSLSERGLADCAPPAGVTLIERDAVAALIAATEVVVSG
jgi:sulfur relay (sulfurtransferase) DsrF/TusC family protein